MADTGSSKKANSPERAGYEQASHRIFLIRHGVTDWNRSFRYQGTSDVELNDEGIEQARLLGLRLASVRPTRVISSPLKRACRTAEIIMAQNESSVPIEREGDIREISFGFWEGLTITEVEACDAETVKIWRRAPFSVAPRGGEPLGDVLARSARVADDLRATGGPGDITFVVAHGAILRALLGILIRAEDMNLLWRMRFDNCCVTIVDLWGRRPSLLLLNDTQHLRMADEGRIADLKFPD